MTEPKPGTPGSENTPTAEEGDAPSVADRAAPGAPPPGSNQPKTEGFQPAQDVTGEPGTIGSADPQHPATGAPRHEAPLSGGGQDVLSERTGGATRGPAPAGAVADDDRAGAARTGAAASAAAPDVVFSPGNAGGVSVPSGRAAGGTSEASEAVTGVRGTAIAPPGKPDGEADTQG
jgi:hypothetical protein